jgi:aminoglycoside phosphotransferase (APT) family kinase protein
VWELTADNALDYLRGQGWLAPGPARAVVLAGGVSNAVLRVEGLDGHCMVVKQSRPQLRTRDEWFSDLERIHREQDVMELLGPLLPEGVVPRVLFADRPRHVLVMEHAPPGACSWKEQLLAGQVDDATAALAGRILGAIHAQTTRRRDELARQGLDQRRVFEQLRVDPFYRRVQERRPEVAGAVAPLIDELLSAREALCHGDFSPKNLLVHGAGLTLVDYETAHLGEPAMDLGFFFSHLILKAFRAAGEYRRLLGLIASAWQGYAAAAAWSPESTLLRRGLGHLGVCLLARIDGTSPVDYLPQEPRREAVRALGRWLLGSRPASWDEVHERLEGCLCRLV